MAKGGGPDLHLEEPRGRHRNEGYTIKIQMERDPWCEWGGGGSCPPGSP